MLYMQTSLALLHTPPSYFIGLMLVFSYLTYAIIGVHELFFFKTGD